MREPVRPTSPYSASQFSVSKLLEYPGHLIWILFAYLPFLGWMNVPLTGDQKVYLSTALEMKLNASWFKPMLFGQGSYFKPPIQYWATLIGWAVFGLNVFASMLPSVLCLLATCWLLGQIGMLLGIRRDHLNVGLWFGSTLGAIVFGTTAQMEIYLCFFYAASWWAGLKYLAAPRTERDIRWLLLAFVVAGVSSLVKSPLYSVFWGAGFLGFLIVTGEWELFLDRRLYLCLLAALLSGSLWFVYITLEDGQHFWAHYFMKETIGKGGGNQSSALSIWWALLYFGFPLSLMMFVAARTAWRRRRSGRMVDFLLCWSLPPAVFFTLYPYRIKPYLFILVPVVALLIDWGLYRGGRSRVFVSVMTATAALLCLVLSFASWTLLRLDLVPVWICLGLLGSGILALWMAIKGSVRSYALSGLVVVLFFRAACGAMGEWDIRGLRAAARAHPDAPIAMLDEHQNIWHELGLLSIGIGRPIMRLESVKDVADFIRKGGIVALDQDQDRDYRRTLEAMLLGMGDTREVHEETWLRWSTRAKLPLREIMTGDPGSLINFKELAQREFKIIWVEKTT